MVTVRRAAGFTYIYKSLHNELYYVFTCLSLYRRPAGTRPGALARSRLLPDKPTLYHKVVDLSTYIFDFLNFF